MVPVVASRPNSQSSSSYAAAMRDALVPRLAPAAGQTASSGRLTIHAFPSSSRRWSPPPMEGLAALPGEAGTGADRPVVAVPVRDSVGQPGGSAQATWRRLRAAEWAAWIRTMPRRVAVILGIGAVGEVLGSRVASRLGLVVAALAAAAAGWGLRFRPSPGSIAWRRGAAGERRTARVLGPVGAVRVGGPARPGRP
jgi:hypothetical protein